MNSKLNNGHDVFNNDRFTIDKICLDADAIIANRQLVKNNSTTSNDHPHLLPINDIERMESHSSFGVDWSDEAHSTSHCWIPYGSIRHSPIPTCAYTLCSISEPFRSESFIQCGTCTISIHSEHIDDFPKVTNAHQYVPPCRPSFSDQTVTHNHSEHYWSHVPKLTKPCIICNHKTLSRSLIANNGRTLTIPTDSKLYKPSSGLICLWCSQGCHRQCLENINDNDDRNKCDYGKYKNIIVRPRWLRRVANSPARYEARFSNDIDAENSSLTPLIVFINKLSGGQKGEVIYHQLIRLLNPRQVFILESDETIKQALDIYSSLRNTRILVCGGDGSIGWMLSTLANRFPSLNNPPVSICPMGTGNDLSRVLGWGSSYSMERLLTTLQQIPNAQPIALDRWQVDFEPLTPDNSIEDTRNIHRCLSCLLNDPKFVLETDPPSYQNYQKPLNVRCTNYISFGLDAAVVLDFHVKRMRDPSKFTSPFRNKIHYLNTARRYFREFALWKSWDLSPYMRLICDGKDFTDSLRHCHTIVLLNIPSYGAGTHPWSGAYADTDPININDQASNRYNNCTFTTDDRSTTATSVKNDQIGIQSISDRKLEVLGLDSIQMALIHLGLRGRHITQCSHVRIELIRSMPVHMDGDPFYLPKSTAVNVTHAGQVVVLRNEIRSS